MYKKMILTLCCVSLLCGMLSCSSSYEGQDPYALLEEVKKSNLGQAYENYNLFIGKQWKPHLDEQAGLLVQFEGVYDLQSIMPNICGAQVDTMAEADKAALSKLRMMAHTALFTYKDGATDVAYSGWSVACADGKGRHFPDQQNNSVKEVLNGNWNTDCPTMIKVATSVCDPKKK